MAKRRSDSLPIPPVTAKKPRSHPTRRRRVVVDRISQLPDTLLVTILSLLPIKDAAGTSVLSHRFRTIWTTCPSLEISRVEFSNGCRFSEATNKCLQQHDTDFKLLRFSLNLGRTDRIVSVSMISSWLTRAHSLGLRHLSLHIFADPFGTLLPLILSLPFIQSLTFSTDTFGLDVVQPILPALFLLTQLRYLHLREDMHHSDLTLLVKAQTKLEYLFLEDVNVKNMNIQSQTLKRLKLTWSLYSPVEMSLTFPRLEFLYMNLCFHGMLNRFYGEMPLLKKAVLKISRLCENCMPHLSDILRSLVNVEELTIYVASMLIEARKRTFHPLVEQGQELQTFPNLRKLKVSVLFHDDSIQDLICLLHHTPALESLKLVHVDQPFNRKKNGWPSKLPRDAQGNNDRVYFTNLQTDGKKDVLIKLLSKKADPRGKRANNKVVPKNRSHVIVI
ncbi:F-box/FBD/LRR-repeat protein [Carex littledalei]|uniref:F-box/FBD/LRR-repeat protein n=1 Tax=Carex littledalei TaxID=544730 RepID=A0A833QMD4_9POAL|nr:F-box/FBD/LRR-repeat protein [Carex littledalei]